MSNFNKSLKKIKAIAYPYIDTLALENLLKGGEDEVMKKDNL